MDRFHDFHDLAAKQGGFITRAQLRAAGLSDKTIKRWVMGGRLCRAYRGVYAVGVMPSDPRVCAHAALLAVGERSALAGDSAAVR